MIYTVEFPVAEKLLFPDEILYKDHEFGCVPKEVTRFSTFILLEETKEGIRYYSHKDNSSLIIRKSELYYFTEVKEDEITLSNYKKKMYTSNEPYSSTIMNRSYGDFLSTKNNKK